MACKEYAEEDDEFVEIAPDEWKSIRDDARYRTFQLWENLQNLDEPTLRLMAKGFIEKITSKSLQQHMMSIQSPRLV
ncbi:hypothetical protein HY463_00315 [Candidatus Peregrinibacteria bacterium]|nr:hypothetical protein [Candidatus Peregrinibacteria bacterium]